MIIITSAEESDVPCASTATSRERNNSMVGISHRNEVDLLLVQSGKDVHMSIEVFKGSRPILVTDVVNCKVSW